MQGQQTPADEAPEPLYEEWSAVPAPLPLEWPDFEPLAPGELDVQSEPQATLLGLPPCCQPPASVADTARADTYTNSDDPLRNPLIAMSVPAADAVDAYSDEHSKLPGICGGLQSLVRRLRRGFA